MITVTADVDIDRPLPEVFAFLDSGEMAWARDSRHLAMLAWGLEGETFISVLDTHDDRTLSDSDPVPNPTAKSQVSPTYRFADRLGMIRVCCPGPEGHGHAYDGPDQFVVVEPRSE